jgi:hypothetical protein
MALTDVPCIEEGEDDANGENIVVGVEDHVSSREFSMPKEGKL